MPLPENAFPGNGVPLGEDPLVTLRHGRYGTLFVVGFDVNNVRHVLNRPECYDFIPSDTTLRHLVAELRAEEFEDANVGRATAFLHFVNHLLARAGHGHIHPLHVYGYDHKTHEGADALLPRMTFKAVNDGPAGGMISRFIPWDEIGCITIQLMAD